MSEHECLSAGTAEVVALRDALKTAVGWIGAGSVLGAEDFKADMAKIEAVLSASSTEGPYAWRCCDERYPHILGLVTDRQVTVEAWRAGGIKHQPLGVITGEPQPTQETFVDRVKRGFPEFVEHIERPNLPLDIWTTWARRDDWHERFVGSDIRQMLGEIQRLREHFDNLPAQPQTAEVPNEVKSFIREVSGIWGAFEHDLRAVMGNTNYAVVREKMVRAEDASSMSRHKE